MICGAQKVTRRKKNMKNRVGEKRKGINKRNKGENIDGK
jgi:hypothetical protein